MGRLLRLVFSLVILVVAGGAALYWFVLRQDGAPAAVSTTCSSTDTTAGATDLAGTWTAQKSTASGQALLKDGAPGSWAGYRVEEDLRAVHVTAVGRTPDVTGTVTVEGTTVTAATFQVDLSTLTSDQSARDGQMHSIGLETDQFPTATFTLGAPIRLGAGGCQEADATGTLNLHGVAKPVRLKLKAAPEGNGFTVTGSTTITMADYGIEPPHLGFVTVDPTGTLELDLALTK